MIHSPIAIKLKEGSNIPLTYKDKTEIQEIAPRLLAIIKEENKEVQTE